ncbi:MAG: sulfatase-like hydrolase/transferase [Bacteroidetes bacterium]|nr:sulfatase-like hydrolase/transferase [Bacteroidota bacterium]
MMSLFFVLRILFVIHNFGALTKESNFDFLFALFQGLRLDLATSCYLLGFPYFLYLLYYYLRWKSFLYTIYGVFFAMVASILLIHVGEICIYPEWNHKLSTRVFNHLAHLDEVGRTAGYGFTLLFLMYVTIASVFIWFFLKYLKIAPLPTRAKGKFEFVPIVFAFLVLPFFFLGARGGWQQIPLNIDSAYFSSHSAVNDLSVNSTYFFGKNYLLYKRGDLDKDLPDINHTDAKNFVLDLYQTDGNFDQVLTSETPNVVFIILEGWSANAMGSLGGEPAVTPVFDSLSKQGLLFDQIYSTSTTSENGNASIFAGYPGVPEISISMRPDKHRSMKTINQLLPEYSSGYLFGGDLKYGNIGGFFLEHDFQKVEDESAFGSDIKRGKLSVHDEDLYKKWLKKLNNAKEPFLECAFTGSTHAPYDHPKRSTQKWTGEEKDFLNSMVYADEELGKFIENCKKESWYKNTLFVVVADHGHATPMETNPVSSKFFKIPLLFFGSVIKKEYQGKVNHVIGSQSDIAATLLKQLNRSTEAFPWSKNLLNPKVKNFAFHSIVRGYGWVRENGSLAYSMDYKRNLDDTHTDPDLAQKHSFEAQQFFITLYNYYKEL